MRLPATFFIFAACALAGFASACGTPKNSADTASALVVDTMKTGATVLAAPPTPTVTKPSAPASSTKTTTTKTTTTKTTTKVVTTRDTAHLGRDSVIRINPNDPRRQLPTVPPKKP